ncbi:MAG TPA: ferritin-like domain-containing protein [Erysipelotrichaceae bacterium]|nr:ferritin-like domain-containing protein [Erysipelotrichaceae bacterium]
MATKINNGGYQQNFNPQTGKYETGKTKRPTYISNKRKLDKIKELAKNGDVKAKDFLFNFRDLDKKDFDSYLNSIDTGKVDESLGLIDELIADEEEAIEGYEKAIEVFENEEIKEILNSIKKDEIEHINILEDLKDKIEGIDDNEL